MLFYIIFFGIGLVVGVLIGVAVENRSATLYVEKAKEEIKSKDNLIDTLTKQVLHLKEDRF